MFSARTNWLLEENELAKLCGARKRAGLPILDLTESNPTRCGFDYGPEALLAAFQNSLMSRYDPDPRGLLSARQAVLEYYQEQGISVTHDQVFLTSSTSEAYSFIFRLICDPADQALAPQPSYPLFDYLARLNDVELVRYSLRYAKRWQIDCEALALQIASRARAILAVHPNNPTGSFVTPKEREFLLQLANKHGLALIADEVFFDYRYGSGSSHPSGQSLMALGDAPKHEKVSHPQPSPREEGGERSEPGEGLEPNLSAHARSQAKDQARVMGSIPGRAPLSFAGERDALVFTLNGLSKVSALPQMKCAWIIVSGPDELVRRACARLEIIADTYLPVSTPVALALPELLASRRPLHPQLMNRLSGNLSALDSQLRAGSPINRLSVEGGWYAILRVPEVRSDESWAIRLLEEDGVLVHPGHFYDFPGGCYLVVSLLPKPTVFASGIQKLIRRVEADSSETTR